MFTTRTFGFSEAKCPNCSRVKEIGIIRDENAGDYPELATTNERMKTLLAETQDILLADEDNMIWFNLVIKDTEQPTIMKINKNSEKYELGDKPGAYYVHFIKKVNKIDTLSSGMIVGNDELFDLVKKEIEKKNVEIWIVTKRLDTFSNYEDIDDDHMLSEDALKRLNMIKMNVSLT